MVFVIIFHQQALITILSKLYLKYFNIHFNTDDDVSKKDRTLYEAILFYFLQLTFW